MYEIETALLYWTKQYTDQTMKETQRETSLCVTFIVMFLLRDALGKFFNTRITDNKKRKEIHEILFRFGVTGHIICDIRLKNSPTTIFSATLLRS